MGYLSKGGYTTRTFDSRLSDARDGAVTINDSGASVDFRVESDGDSNCLIVDGSADSVGIGEATPSGKLEIMTGTTGNDLHITFKETASNKQRVIFSESGVNAFAFEHDGSGSSPDNVFSFLTGSATSGIDTTSFTVYQDGDVHFAERIYGGLGGTATGSSPDWDDNWKNDLLLLGTDTNGPGGSVYFHTLTFEFGATKDGGGNLTQLAIGYNTLNCYMRYKYGGSWSSWSSAFV